jgi:hypothetical protein
MFALPVIAASKLMPRQMLAKTAGLRRHPRTRRAKPLRADLKILIHRMMWSTRPCARALMRRLYRWLSHYVVK